jgi:hypothetical protein
LVRDPLGALSQLADGLGGSSLAAASDLDPLKAIEGRKKTLYEGLKNVSENLLVPKALPVPPAFSARFGLRPPSSV